jgi:hypothetical protein
MARTLQYKTVKEMQIKIDEYFEYCDNRTREMHSEKLGDMIVPDPEPYTMSGLAWHLDLSRQALIDYEHRDLYLDAIKKARQRVEYDNERRLVDKRTFTPGIIFNLKNNFGWRDKTETDITSGGKPIPILGGHDTNNSDKETS